MCTAIPSIITFSSKREIRRRDLSGSGCVDACWDVASIVFRSFEYLLCFVGLVRDALRGVGTEATDRYGGLDDLVGRHNLCEIVDSELD
jgi:hypothetical protein